jgi:hypothetical protein
MLLRMTREEIIAKIRKVEALFSGSEFAGEMNAAASALERLNAQLKEAPEALEEYKFSLPDPWKRQLFLALARRHGLKPYRQYRQRSTTVMLRTTNSFLAQILWPEFIQLERLLHDYLTEATRDIISRGVHGDLSEAPETPILEGM